MIKKALCQPIKHRHFISICVLDIMSFASLRFSSSKKASVHVYLYVWQLKWLIHSLIEIAGLRAYSQTSIYLFFEENPGSHNRKSTYSTAISMFIFRAMSKFDA